MLTDHKELVYKETSYDKPEKILADIEDIDKKISQGLKELKGLVNER